MAVTYRATTPRTLKLTHGFTSLLTPDGYNPKLRKGRAKGYSSAVMHFAPASLSGYNVCRWSSAGCRGGCLNTAGHGGIVKRGETTNAIQLARIARTRWFFEDRPSFLAQLYGEIETHVRRAIANGLVPVVRLNGTSDIPWERVKDADGLTAFERFPTIRFYDYTKSSGRMLQHITGKLAYNYHLTFSRSETNSADVDAILRAGGNVAAVFKTAALPAVWNGTRVVNGDTDDLRFLDPSGVYVGLKAKGKAKRDASGFMIDPAARPARVSIALPMLTVA